MSYTASSFNLFAQLMHALRYWTWQLRRPSFRLLFLALMLAVAAIASVGIFSARLEAALMRDANQLLGGDLVIESRNNPIQSSWYALFASSTFSSLQKAQSVVFPSVISAPQNDVLVSLKAVSSPYPLQGKLWVQDAAGRQNKNSNAPPLGEVWVDQGVPASLGIRLGDRIRVGQWSAPVTRIVLLEPDRGAGFASFAPRVMINMGNLQDTQLLGPGSRAKWRVYVTGPTSLVQDLKKSLLPLLEPSQELESLENGRPELSQTLDRAQDFLSMAALIGTLVSCVGIALIAHQYSREQSRELAILKSIGYTPGQLFWLSFSSLGILVVLAGGAGAILGWLAHSLLLKLLANLIGVDLPLAGLEYLPIGVLLAALLLVGFAGVPTWYALKAPAIAVIRKHSLAKNKSKTVWSLVFACVTALAVCFLTVKDPKLALYLFAGFLLTCLVFSVLFWWFLKMSGIASRAFVRRNTGIHVFKSMSKRAPALVLQGLSLSLGLAALLVLGVVQGDLIDRWQDLVPPNAPNRFVFNVQPEQVSSLQDKLDANVSQPVQLYPMVRGRLTAIQGKPIVLDNLKNEQAKRVLARELNLSFTDVLPKHNTLLQGRWFDTHTGKQTAEVSLEKGLATQLGLRLGDRLTFDIAGSAIQAQVTSIRSLRWDSMEVNFFVLFPTQILNEFPQTWITSFYLAPQRAENFSRELIRLYPNLTVLDTALVLSQLRNILNQVSQAIQFVFLFTVLAGGLVVVACVLTGARARTQEAAIYRVLGASTRQLQKAAWAELAILGGLAGLIAALAAQALGWGLAHFVFEFEYVISFWSVLLGTMAGISVSILFGAWSIHKVCNAPVSQTLRQVDV